MGSLKRLILVTAVALAATTAAKAADLPDPIIPAQEFIPEEVGGGWYLRGDIGVDFFNSPDAVYNNWLQFSGEKLQTAGMIGVGAGYQFNEWIRADLTADWRGTSFNGKTACGLPCNPGALTQENADIGIFTGMANIYLEAGNFNGFTPYVGGGIGFAHLRLHDYVGINPNGTSNSFNDKNKTNFAWNLTAGTSYDIWDNLAVDANYRYVDFGDIGTGGDPAGNLPGTVEFDKLTAHEIRVGLRYYLN